MPHRTPSFIVVGLVLTMFLLGFFYMSCSSTATELRQTLGEFEERVRFLTMKNSGHEKDIESLNSKKDALEDEKNNIQKQMEKKDGELNDVNTKLNQKLTELESMKSDKQVLDLQLQEFRNMSDLLLSKNSAIEKIEDDIHQQKLSHQQQVNDLKQQIENYKQQINQSSPPLSSANETIQNSSVLVQQSSANTSIPIQSNITQPLDQNATVLDPAANILDVHQRLQRSLNDSLVDHKLSNETDMNNQTQLNLNSTQMPVDLTTVLTVNQTNLANNQSQLLADDQHNRQ